MKRPLCDTSDDFQAEPKQLRASTVRLNVGGRVFETTADTLAANCPYFDPILNGRIGMGVDPEGCFFIDRSPDLFATLLEWMRTHERPSTEILKTHGAAILRECDYYGIEGLPEVIRGSLAPPCFMRAADRRIREEEATVLKDPLAHTEILQDVHKADTSLRPREGLQQPIILGAAARPSVQGGYAAFYERFNATCPGLLDELRAIEHIVIAGGSVLGALIDRPCTDIDIFVVGPPEHGVDALRQVYDAVRRYNAKDKKKKRYLATRSQHAVTFYMAAAEHLPIQVILQTHASIAELLCGFDVDCACFCFAPLEGRVLTTPRGLRALQYTCNLMDTLYAGPTYCRRLEKYAARGFGIAAPGYMPDRVSAAFLGAEYAQFPNHDAIFRLDDQLQRTPETMHVAYVNRDACGSCTVVTEDVKVPMRQHCRIVRDVERLLVKDRLTIRRLTPPEVKHCEKHNRVYTMDPFASDACLLLSSGKKDCYWLLWGAEAAAADTSGSDIDEASSYEKTPLARVYELFKKYVDRELQADDAVVDGGALKALANKVAVDTRCAVDLVLAQQSKGDLRLVYQVVRNDRMTFEQLSWILDAGRKPLEALPSEEFQRKYALPRFLAFRPREQREAVEKDFWYGVY